MIIEQLTIGPFETNCYVLRKSAASACGPPQADTADKDCVIIDAGIEPVSLIGYLQENQLNPVAVVLTHGHIDHTAGLDCLLTNWPHIKIYIHSLDEPMLAGKNNLAELAGMPAGKIKADCLLEDGQIIELAGIMFVVLHTPGHTPGGICLYSSDEQTAFVGDTLFAGSVGRTDFPGGDTRQLLNSIKEKLLNLPGSTKVYPGHGPATTIANEKKRNPFL
jgi:glyoxylase-like metal-dependent hydrolase (beta-lactamase superfamily II)